MEKRLKGKVVIVTGGSSGIGFGAALRAAQEGATVVLASRSEDKLNEAATTISTETGAKTLAVPTDVSSVSAIEHLVNTTVQEFGAVDGAFLNAGTFVGAPFAEVTEEAYNKQLDTNLKSVTFGIKYVMAAMKDKGTKGSIVVCSSIMSSAPRVRFPAAALYTASKAAAEALVQYAAMEGADAGIRVNAVKPGSVRTNITQRTDEEYDQGSAQLQLVPRAGRPAEIASLVAYLLADESSFVTGSCIDIDGGFRFKA